VHEGGVVVDALLGAKEGVLPAVDAGARSGGVPHVDRKVILAVGEAQVADCPVALLEGARRV